MPHKPIFMNILALIHTSSMIIVISYILFLNVQLTKYANFRIQLLWCIYGSVFEKSLRARLVKVNQMV